MTRAQTIHLWEFAPSPHLGNILAGMVSRGYQARYIVHSETYQARKNEGWYQPQFKGVDIVKVRGRDEIRDTILGSRHDDVHICVGLRGNDHVQEVISSFRRTRRKFWVFMETVNERRSWSVLKRPIYRLLLLQNRPWIEGVLAAGATTSKWLVRRGLSHNRVFDFAYFLNESAVLPFAPTHRETGFRLLFVGSLISLKRVHLIIDALRELPTDVTLDIVGDGPLREELEEQAKIDAPGRVIFHGTRPMTEIADFMAGADCLVLPSDHDGWGAVISEALLVGTRVVCSDRCGASIAVTASGAGQVFDAFADEACAAALRNELARGPISIAERIEIANWAKCLTKTDGAAYLEAIIVHTRQGAPRPAPPWNGAKLRSERPS